MKLTRPRQLSHSVERCPAARAWLAALILSAFVPADASAAMLQDLAGAEQSAPQPTIGPAPDPGFVDVVIVGRGPDRPNSSRTVEYVVIPVVPVFVPYFVIVPAAPVGACVARPATLVAPVPVSPFGRFMADPTARFRANRAAPAFEQAGVYCPPAVPFAPTRRHW